MTPANEGAPIKHHVHHSYIWLGSLRAFGILLVALVIGGFSSLASLVSELGAAASSGALLSGALIVPIAIALILGACVLVFLIIVGIHALAYKYLFYELGPEEFNLYSGIITKKRVHVPYQRIQSVDQRASLIQRIFGVCNVHIDTAGGAANKAILVPYLSKGEAERLRVELYARRSYAKDGIIVPAGQPAAPEAGADAAAAQGNILDMGEEAWRQFGGVFAGDGADLGAVSYEFGLTNKELVLSGLSHSSGVAVAIFAVLAALGQFASFFFDVVPEGDQVLTDTLTQSAVMFGASNVIAFTAGAVAVAVLVVYAISALGSVLSFGGFHARRRGDRIEVERGLLQHQSQSVSVERVQSVIVKQTLIRKLIGYAEISIGKIETANEGDSSTDNGPRGFILHPFCKLSQVPEVVSRMLPEYADAPDEPVKLAPCALRRGIIRRCLWQGSGFWLAASTAIAQVILNLVFNAQLDALEMTPSETEMALFITNSVAVALYLLAVVLLVLDAIGSVLWFRGSSFGVNRTFMQVTNSGLSRQVQLFPRNKIQFGYTKVNPLQKRAGTATINASSAGGAGGTVIRLIDVERAAADQWLRWLEPRSHA